MKVSGVKSEMILNMCRELGADAYLSGMGASHDYLDVAAFERAGIELIWQDFRHPSYEQHPTPQSFVERLSTLDFLFNCGSQSAALFAAAPSEMRVPRPDPEPEALRGVPA